MNLNVKAKTKTVCHWINQGETLHLRKLDNFYSLNIQTFKTSKTSDVERFLNHYDLVSEFQKRLWCNETIYIIYFSSCTSGSICIVLYSLFVCLVGCFGYCCKNCQSIQLPCTERDCLTARAHEIHANIVNRSVIVDRGKVCETHSFNGKM